MGEGGRKGIEVGILCTKDKKKVCLHLSFIPIIFVGIFCKFILLFYIGLPIGTALIFEGHLGCTR
jgi:hypothetical protein